MAVQNLTGDSFNTRPQIYLGLSKVFNQLRRTEDPPGYLSDYHMMEIAGGCILPVERQESFAGSGPLAEISFSMVTGGLENHSTNQKELALRLGWWQRIYRGFYAQPKISFGHAWNELNFEEGLIPQNGTAFLLGGAGLAGYSIQLAPDLSIDLAGGYFVERSVTGEDYVNYGPLVQATIKGTQTKK